MNHIHRIALIGLVVFGTATEKANAEEPVRTPRTSPLASVLRDSQGRNLFVPNPETVATLLYRRALLDPRKNALVLSTLQSGGGPEMVAFVTDSLLEHSATCWLIDSTWHEILDSLRDYGFLSNQRIREKIGQALARSSCAIEAPDAVLAFKKEESFLSWLFDTKNGIGFDALAFSQTSTTGSLTFVETSEGKLELVGTLMLVRYEDPVQSEDVNRFAARFSQQSAEAGLRWKSRQSHTLSLLAHYYTYGSSTDLGSANRSNGSEAVVAFQKEISNHFALQLSVHAGRGGRYPDRDYCDVRIIGKYIPKFWR